jgi:hypothetical protein
MRDTQDAIQSMEKEELLRMCGLDADSRLLLEKYEVPSQKRLVPVLLRQHVPPDDIHIPLPYSNDQCCLCLCV